jgi:hypothetical protein
MAKILTTTKLTTLSMKVGARIRKLVVFKCEFTAKAPQKEISARKKDVIDFLRNQKNEKPNGKRFNLKHNFIEVNRHPLIYLLVTRLERKPNDGGDVTPPTPPTGPVPKMK